MTNPRRGEIYLVRLPGQPKDTKFRPALVVSLDVRNRLANDVIVIPISTTLDKSFLIRGPFSGAISDKKMLEIEQAIQRAVGIIV